MGFHNCYNSVDTSKDSDFAIDNFGYKVDYIANYNFNFVLHISSFMENYNSVCYNSNYYNFVVDSDYKEVENNCFVGNSFMDYYNKVFQFVDLQFVDIALDNIEAWVDNCNYLK